MIFLCVKQYKTQIQNTQIQHITKCQKHPTYGIFLKRGLFKDITNDIPICQTGKYKNASTQIHKCGICQVPERPKMWYIFEKRIFQGYQKLYTGPSISRFGIFSLEINVFSLGKCIFSQKILFLKIKK